MNINDFIKYGGIDIFNPAIVGSSIFYSALSASSFFSDPSLSLSSLSSSSVLASILGVLSKSILDNDIKDTMNLVESMSLEELYEFRDLGEWVYLK